MIDLPRGLARAVAIALLVFTTGAWAQGYPVAGKTIRFVIGFPAGSTIDNVSRILLDDIQQRTGANFVVDNRPGALGVLGMDAVATAAADGYTMGPSSSATNSSGWFLSKAAQRLDPIKGFTHVGRVTRFDVVVVTSATSDYASAPRLIAAAKARPGALSYGYGSGTGEVAAAAFARAAGIRLLGVPYKGQPPALTDLVGGQVDVVAADVGAVLPLVRARSIVPVALISERRSTILPDVPTLRELGLPGLNLTGWIGVEGPPRLPSNVVQWWETQLRTSIANPAVAKRMRDMGVEPDLLTGEAFQRFVEQQRTSWGREIQEAGIQAE